MRYVFLVVRLLGPSNQCLQNDPSPFLYVAGWLKRGPTGVIAATMYDAIETADSIIADVKNSALPSHGAAAECGFVNGGVEHMLKARGVRPVSWEGWKKIDAIETKEGDTRGKPREKIADVKKMMEIVKR